MLETTVQRLLDYAEYQAAGDHTVVGTVKVIEGVWSPQLENERDILIYLPPSYDQGVERYPVIYMHDGQNLFDEATSFAREWRVDETLEQASQHGVEAIVVGIPNMGAERVDEYAPFVDMHSGGGQGQAYLNFVVETVKPLVDESFRTQPDREHTGIMGSSMGGLISLYAFFHYGHIFGRAGVMSPALWFAQRAIFGYVQQAALQPGKIYLDVGTEEGWPALSDARLMRRLLEQKGYGSGTDLLYVEAQGQQHCESAWAERLSPALRFLLA